MTVEMKTEWVTEEPTDNDGDGYYTPDDCDDDLSDDALNGEYQIPADKINPGLITTFPMMVWTRIVMEPTMRLRLKR